MRSVRDSVLFLETTEYNGPSAVFDPALAASVGELKDWAEYIVSRVEFVTGYTVDVDEDGGYFTVELDLEGYYRDLRPNQQRELARAVGARYREGVRVTATVERDKRKHVGTKVTLTPVDGSFDLSDLSREPVEGVGRTRISQTEIVFAMAAPSHEAPAVEALARRVAEALNLYVVSFELRDGDADAALNPHFDYEAPTSPDGRAVLPASAMSGAGVE